MRTGIGFGRSIVFLLGGMLFFAAMARAQFNGDFSIEKHELDSENFLDWRAYQSPFPWRYEHYVAPNFLRATIGSLSKAQFYQFHEIRLEKDIGRYFSVLYQQKEDAFFRPDPIYREIEFRFGEQWYASIIGFPQHEKVKGHQGVSVAHGERTDWNYIRLSRLKEFILFNEENDTNQLFSPNPFLYRLEFRFFWREKLFVQGKARREDRARLLTPDEGKEETYEGDKLDLVVDYWWSRTFLLGLNYSGNREDRIRLPDGSGFGTTRASQRLGWRWSDLYLVTTFSGGDVLETGILRGLFENRIAAELTEENFDHRLSSDSLYAVWSHVRSEWFRWVFSFQAGRVNRLLVDGGASRVGADLRSDELKAGVGIVLQEEGSYRAFFNTTWDLDLFGTRQWDGGNVQFQFLF